MGVAAFLSHKATSTELCCKVYNRYKQELRWGQRLGKRQEGTISSEEDILRENGQWVCHWHGVIACGRVDFTWAVHPRDQEIAQRMHGEPNISMCVCVKEMEALVLIRLCMGEVIADEDIPSTRTSRFLDGGGLSPP